MSETHRRRRHASAFVVLLAGLSPSGCHASTQPATPQSPVTRSLPVVGNIAGRSPDDIRGSDGYGRVGCVITGPPGTLVAVRGYSTAAPTAEVRVGTRVTTEKHLYCHGPTGSRQT